MDDPADTPADRVDAAFRRLARFRDATVDLRSEPHAGVRRHLLTVLAGRGEVDLVLTVAERAEDVFEREHAVVLAIQLGAAPPRWLAERFVDGSDPLRRILLEVHPDRVDWEMAADALVALATEQDSPLARAAARRLFASGRADNTLRDLAVRDPHGLGPVLEAWAASEEAPALVERVVAGELAPRDLGGARFAFAVLEPYLDAEPELLAAARSVPRDWLVRRLHARLVLGAWIPESWLERARGVVRAPFTDDERQRFATWSRLGRRGGTGADPRPALARRALRAVGAQDGVVER